MARMVVAYAELVAIAANRLSRHVAAAMNCFVWIAKEAERKPVRSVAVLFLLEFSIERVGSVA
jgi:hypothetical protein